MDNRRRNALPAVRGPVPPAAGGRWRFVVIVGSVPGGPATPFLLDRVTSCVLGSGATVLEEPFGPLLRIRFDWPAPSWAEAIVAGVRAVEAVGLAVLRVDSDDWVTAADIAHRVGRSRETVRMWACGQKGPGGFPPPANPRREVTFYLWAEVLPWLRDRLGMDVSDEQPVLAAANLAVQLRGLLPRVPRFSAVLDLLNAPATVAGPPGVR